MKACTMICSANQLTGFYKITTSTFNKLNKTFRYVGSGGLGAKAKQSFMTYFFHVFCKVP